MIKSQKGAWNVRVLVPAFIGVVLARVIAQFPTVADVIAWCDAFILEVTAQAGLAVAGAPTVFLVNAALTALTIWAWYLAAHKIGDHFPLAEKWMLGSAARPTYQPRYGK